MTSDGAEEAARPPVLRLAPHPGPQSVFSASSASVILYGGAAGGGKTYAGILKGVTKALQDPHFRGVVFRRTAPDLSQSGGPWDVLVRLATLTGGRINLAKMKVVWPNGAQFLARHMQHEHSAMLYQGGEYTYIFFDELEFFTFGQVSFLIQRLRGKSKPQLILTCNPNLRWRPIVEPWLVDGTLSTNSPDLAKGWVTFREGTPQVSLARSKPGVGWLRIRVIPAWLNDNPSVDPEYRDRLEATAEVERLQKLEGRWDVIRGAQIYRAARWVTQPLSSAPAGLRWVRSWDLAATEPSAANPDPDWTAGVLIARHRASDGTRRVYVRDGRWARIGPAAVEALIAGTATEDGRDIPIIIEEEPGSSGKGFIDQLARGALRGYAVSGHRPTGDKVTRQRPLVAHAERAEIVFLDDDRNASWMLDLRAWAATYPDGKRDAWDAIAQGYAVAAETHDEPPRRKQARKAGTRRAKTKGIPTRM